MNNIIMHSLQIDFFFLIEYISLEYVINSRHSELSNYCNMSLQII